MAIISIFQCDKCKKEFTRTSQSISAAGYEVQPCVVGIHIAYGETNPSAARVPAVHALWCRTCVNETGIHAPTKASDDAPQPLSFEERVTLLLEELGFKREE